MADFLYLAGATYAAYNLVSGATLTVTSENTLFPKENLFSADPSEPFRFNAAAPNDLITIDLGSAQSIDLCSIHGHNIDSGIGPSGIRLYSKASAFGAHPDGVLEATFVKRDPAFFTRLSASVSRRYWRVVFVGRNGSPIEIGELVLGLASTLTQKPIAQSWSESRSQIRNRTAAGSVRVFNLTRFAARTLKLGFRGTRTQMDEVRDSIYVASGQGAVPVVLVPFDTATDVILATVGSSMQYTPISLEVYEYELVVAELGFGVAS